MCVLLCMCQYLACRSPYDLSRNSRLWAYGAYASLEEALKHVVVQNEAEAVAAIEDEGERARAAKLLVVPLPH